MRVFVLSTGRCGSTTFFKSCSHIINYTSGHETRSHMIGKERIEYEDFHIEIDNRLSWQLGRLEERYGDSPLYIHLHRDRVETAKSFMNRFNPKSIILAYSEGVIMNYGKRHDDFQVCLDYVDSVNANIRSFLRDKDFIDFPMEESLEWFRHFWNRIGAKGNYAKAYNEWSVKHNAS